MKHPETYDVISKQCIYCQKLPGEQHKEDCVKRYRTVVISVTLPLTVRVPEFWSDEDIESYYNESSVCADNTWDDLKVKIDGRKGCLCNVMECSYLREATEADEGFKK